MPSLLDATLVVQMIHFLCAYWILSNFFLKRAYALVMKIDAERAALKNGTILLQEELAAQRQEKIAEFSELQQTLQSQLPVHGYISLGKGYAQTTGHAVPAITRMGDSLKRASSLPSPQGKISREQKQELINQLAAQLKKRVIDE